MFATIDIGTNSVLLLIGDVKENGSIAVVEEHAEITRLGEGVAASGIITVAAAQRTMPVLDKYRERCRACGVKEIVVVGTAALRIAKNAPEFLSLIKKQLGLSLDVLSAEREALLTFSAATHDFGNNITLIDIGGGSTEIMSSTSQMTSLPFGSVILTERFLTSNPVTEEHAHALTSYLDQAIPEHLTAQNIQPSKTLIATAGTATTLAAMHQKLESFDQAKVHGYTFSKDNVANLITELKPLTIERRKKLPGLHPQRAEPILAGAILLERSMHHLHFTHVTVSDRGLRWGLFYEKFT